MFYPSKERVGRSKIFQASSKCFDTVLSEAIPIFFDRLKSVFFFFPCPIAIKFSPVIGYGLKFVKMQF